MKTKTQKSEIVQWLEKEYPRGVDLVYIDYRDEIESAEDREKILQEPDEAYEVIDGRTGWISDAQYESVRHIEDEYYRQHDEVDLSEEDREELQTWCYEHDISDPLKDLLKNTRREYMYYDTGVYIEPLDYTGAGEVKKRARAIAKKLKLDYQKHEGALIELVENAYYGGQLVILFENNISEFLADAKYIKFNGSAEVCLMDRGQGSGHSVNIGDPLLFEFVRDNLHTDKGDNGYSYAYDVCGLVGGIMEDGVLTNKKEQDIIRVKTNEDRKAQREREAEYIKRWNKGKGTCTFGDMNIRRHASAPYRNDYPCGNKCEKCGTFWID